LDFIFNLGVNSLIFVRAAWFLFGGMGLIPQNNAPSKIGRDLRKIVNRPTKTGVGS